VEAVCPFLALGADGRSVVDGADPAHRCHAEEPPGLIERTYQARICLTGAHVQCERYLARTDLPANHELARAAIGDGLVSTRLVLAPEPAWHGLAGRARVGRRGGIAALVAAATVLTIGTVAVVVGALRPPDGEEPTAARASDDSTVPPTPSPSAEPTLRPTVLPTPSPIATPSATVAPTVPPTVAPTAVPTPAPQETYVVQQGDTLAAIAQQFGVTVAAIQAANGIEDADEIIIGQVLVIP
jgi:LysM repeat protein